MMNSKQKIIDLRIIYNINNLKMRTGSRCQQLSSGQDLQYFNFETDLEDLSERVKINLNYPVFLNKSAIQVFSCQNNPQMLKSLQTKIDYNMIQKLNLSRCNIQSFSQFLPNIQNQNDLQTIFPSKQNINLPIEKHFRNLKQLILQNNYIDKIPQNICTLESLLILKLNRNQIRYIPYLGYISHFQIRYNPIKQLSISIKKCRITHFQMDWIDFLIQKTINFSIIDNSFSRTQYFMQLLNSIDNRNSDLVNFNDIFQIKIKNKSEEYRKRIISIYFNKALNMNFSPFFQYLKTLNNINFNQLKFNGKLILEKVLQESYQFLIPLFMQKKTNLNSNDLYFQSICLVCKYSNLKLFKYLMTMKTKKMILAQHQQFIRMQILYSFDLKLSSDHILTQIIQNSNKKVPEIFTIPNDFTKKQSQCIGQALVFIITNDYLLNKFNFYNQRNFQNDQLYLQFAIHIKNIFLLKLLLFKVKINPFIYNFYFKTARTSKGSILGKKILFKIQKNMFMNHSLRHQINEFQKVIKNQKQNESVRYLKKDAETLLSCYLQKQSSQNIYKQNNNQQMKLKELQIMYLKVLQQKIFKQKDPIQLKRSNIKINYEIQEKQKQKCISIKKKVKKHLLQKLKNIKEENQIMSNQASESKGRPIFKAKIKNQLIEYEIYQKLQFASTDFTNLQNMIKQKKNYLLRKQSESIPFCNNQNYKQTNEIQFSTLTKNQQDKSCGNFCLEVNQVHKDQCVYYT